MHLLGAGRLTPSAPPFVGVTADATVSALVLRGLLTATEPLGVPRESLLAVVDCCLDKLDDPDARIPLRAFHDACSVALRLSGDPALGLRWADSSSATSFAPLSNLIAHSASLRQGLSLLAQYFLLLSDQGSYEVVPHGDRLLLRCVPALGEAPELRRFSAELIVGGFWRLFHWFGGAARPAQPCFAYPAPAYRDVYDGFFGQAPTFEAPFSGFVFDDVVLQAASPLRDDEVRAALEEVAERRLLRVTQSTPYALRVRDLLVQDPAPHRVEMESVAGWMELSVRSLRRRLSDEGMSYQAVQNEAAALVAGRLLRNTRRTIGDIAYEMGFSETSAFHRAFKRWTGKTPSAYRDAELGRTADAERSA